MNFLHVTSDAEMRFSLKVSKYSWNIKLCWATIICTLKLRRFCGILILIIYLEMCCKNPHSQSAQWNMMTRYLQFCWQKRVPVCQTVNGNQPNISRYVIHCRILQLHYYREYQWRKGDQNIMNLRRSLDTRESARAHLQNYFPFILDKIFLSVYFLL